MNLTWTVKELTRMKLDNIEGRLSYERWVQILKDVGFATMDINDAFIQMIKDKELEIHVHPDGWKELRRPEGGR
jgi:uncharacterized protein Smg (DUF494 family)